MLLKLNSTEVLANFINSTNTASGMSVRGGQMTMIQHIRTNVNSFHDGNTSEEATDVKRTHELILRITIFNKTSKFKLIFDAIRTIKHEYWL